MNTGIDIRLEFRIYDGLLLKEGYLGFPLPSVTQEKLAWAVAIAVGRLATKLVATISVIIATSDRRLGG